ncbi:Metallo-hydrolase/oxidoreductase [Eremomyces bilateralis CBS 781.70]|uniref:Metallo-hydrolase/oxidoreductase n=1 Tax=Eremomyces bilateralis CBS 781.70 TaxID=1392243 RepID=A0A6G1FU45_9PEZI|nr:Metallo-hydrolase/oxidoreductase [Eremomyces bilateralis CBS 781.70]KAF1809226.1 Metallo-hydrolase/oxidoreductase [Eremomyces bilateralis CBS 781.70]
MDLFVQGSAPDDIRRVPSMSWLIEHQVTKRKVVFDLGIRRDIENYPPTVYERLQTVVKTEVPQDVFESLNKLHIDPQNDVDTVIISHLHYDHVGDPSKFGPNVTFLLGPGAEELILGPKTYPTDPESNYDSNLIPQGNKLSFLPVPSTDTSGFWEPLGPFPQTHDFFGDKSLFIINAPGHCIGHLNALVRVDNQKWLYLAADTTHNARILHGTAQTAIYTDEATGLRCKSAHSDLEAAEAHLQRVQEFARETGVEIILAHDADWYEANLKNY